MNHLSQDRINSIVAWLRRGMSVRAVATLAEVSRNSVLRYKKRLEVGADLSSDAPIERDGRKPSARIFIRASRATLDRLEDVADQMDSSREEVATVILETVCRDDLIDAVLGEH